jgi:hypothetical protein
MYNIILLSLSNHPPSEVLRLITPVLPQFTANPEAFVDRIRIWNSMYPLSDIYQYLNYIYIVIYTP